jgi:hypothetical protein
MIVLKNFIDIQELESIKNNLTKELLKFGSFDNQVSEARSMKDPPSLQIFFAKSLEVAQKFSLEKLMCDFCYARMHNAKAELKPHTDIPALICSISFPILQEKPWDFFIGSEKCSLNLGECVIFNGVKVNHWREPLKEKMHVQASLHFKKSVM